jgi:hypothetical protein
MSSPLFVENLWKKNLAELRKMLPPETTCKTKQEACAILLKVDLHNVFNCFHDQYTKEILIQRYEQHKSYVLDINRIKGTTGLPIRLPVMPEDISENMVKFIIHLWLGDATSNWAKSSKCTKKPSGDLISLREGPQ